MINPVCRGACGKNYSPEHALITGNWRKASPGKSYAPAFFYFKILITPLLTSKISLYLLTFNGELCNRHISYPSSAGSVVFGVHLSAQAAFRLDPTPARLHRVVNSATQYNRAAAKGSGGGGN